MWRALLLCSLVLLAAFAGCMGSGKQKSTETPRPTTGSPIHEPTAPEEPTPSKASNSTSSSTTTASGPNVTASVLITNFTAATNTTTPDNITWRVEVQPPITVRAAYTELRWSNASVLDANASVPTAYANASGRQENASVPDDLSANVTFPKAGLYYLRAYANVSGRLSWSSEIVVNVTWSSKVYTVRIGTSTYGPLSNYNPDPIRVKVGDIIVWRNVDAAGAPHSATSDDGVSPAFDTGTIPPTFNSKRILFETAGTYDYHCLVHPSTMAGQIIVG